MSDDSLSPSPFFINTKRRQSADSYFEIGRAKEKLRKFLNQKQTTSGVSLAKDEDWQGCGRVGYYGIDRYIKLDDDDEDDNYMSEDDFRGGSHSSFGLFWMTFKNIASSIAHYFSTPNSTRRSLPKDMELNKPVVKGTHDIEAMYKVPSLNESQVKQDVFVYGDVNYLIQKFRLDLRKGSVDVALFTVELPKITAGRNDYPTDLQTFIVSPECGSYVWIENGTASAIFVTQSTDNFFGSVLEWFRKILSDMVLADSVMIGHPYYWHPSVRRRLTRVMKYLKRLYRTLAMREKKKKRLSSSASLNTNQIEVMFPEDISKIVINEQSSSNLVHTTSTYEKLNLMLERLVRKWFDYQHTVRQSCGETLRAISETYSSSRLKIAENAARRFLESVTFLDFFSNTNNPRSDRELTTKSKHSNVQVEKSRSRNNNNVSERSDSAVISFKRAPEPDSSFSIREGCHSSVISASRSRPKLDHNNNADNGVLKASSELWHWKAKDPRKCRSTQSHLSSSSFTTSKNHHV